MRPVLATPPSLLAQEAPPARPGGIVWPDREAMDPILTLGGYLMFAAAAAFIGAAIWAGFETALCYRAARGVNVGVIRYGVTAIAAIVCTSATAIGGWLLI
ncbi:hypothetical protein L1080_037525 [Rhodococcus sp. MSC1_016]|jgi:hypothetical protein|uniref:hypothetical protein n=1 Tax=Rhodococcus sp. MSC1_016 TaxID=2909266 RepID=UPI0020307141|nr:hypothetical protein [Rhodococcus sp. MSC1_016]